jgi:hypothetical protein
MLKADGKDDRMEDAARRVYHAFTVPAALKKITMRILFDFDRDILYAYN